MGQGDRGWDRRGTRAQHHEAYRELCDYYEDEAEDRIYLFGFSRGAYTVRSLAGLVSCCGLLKTEELPEPEIWKRIEHVFQKGYRRKTESLEDWLKKEWQFRQSKDGHRIPMRFLGVWDTVGALGIRNDMAFLNLIDNLTATGEWMDSSIKCGPGGTDDGNFHPAELAQIAASALGWVENIYKKLTRNSEADFRFTKRHEDMPWFCLVGAIANGGGVDAKGHTVRRGSPGTSMPIRMMRGTAMAIIVGACN